jgi:hypothetical protein
LQELPEVCLEGLNTPSHSWILVIAGERQEITRMRQSFLIGLAVGQRLFVLQRATPPRDSKGRFLGRGLIGRKRN